MRGVFAGRGQVEFGQQGLTGDTEVSCASILQVFRQDIQAAFVEPFDRGGPKSLVQSDLERLDRVACVSQHQADEAVVRAVERSRKERDRFVQHEQGQGVLGQPLSDVDAHQVVAERSFLQAGRRDIIRCVLGHPLQQAQGLLRVDGQPGRRGLGSCEEQASMVKLVVGLCCSF